MDKITNELNNITINQTPKLLRSGKNRLENKPKKPSQSSSTQSSIKASSSSTTCKSTAEASSSTNSSNKAISKTTSTSSFAYASSSSINPPNYDYSDLSDSDIFFDEDDLEDSFIFKPPAFDGHKELILTTTKFGKPKLCHQGYYYTIARDNRYKNNVMINPKKETIKVFQQILNSAPSELSEFLIYFETYYIGKLKPGSKSIRQVPSFPIELWNVYNNVINDEPRTNNSLESWHKQFASDIHSHPDVNKLLNKFREEQKSMEFLYEQLKAGDVYSRKKSEINKDEALKKLIKDFDLNSALKILDNIVDVMRNSK